MGKFSKIFHHIETKDLRNKYEQKKAAKIQEEKKKKEFKQYLVSTMETKKYNWREGMTTSDVATINVEKLPGDGDVTVIDTIDSASYEGTTGVIEPGDNKGAFVGTVIRDSGSGNGADGGFNVGGKYLAFQGVGDAFNNARFAVLKAIDSSQVDTITITAIVGNDVNGGEDPDLEAEALFVMYKTPAMDRALFLGMPPAGDSFENDDTIIKTPLDGQSGRRTNNGGLNDYSLTIPDYARVEGTQFILFQNFNSGSEFDHFGITKINFQRKAPMNVVVPLDNPEASSFIRSAPPKSTPKKRKKAVDDKLEASDEYTLSKFGNDFPGREVRVGGDDPFASAKIGDDVEPSPQSRTQVKKAFGAADLKSALGQPDIQKADPQANVTNIVKSGKVKTQQSPPTRAQTTTPKQNTIQVVGKDGGIVNTIPVNTQTQPDQAQSGMSLSDFNTKKEKTKEQAILSKGKPQGPTSNNLITTVNETDIESEPDLLDELQNFGTNVSNKIEQGLDNALEYLAKPIPETTKGKGQGGRPVGDTTNRYDGVNTSGRYNLNLATELPISIVTGQPREIKISEEGAISMVNSIKSKEQLNNLSNFVTFNKSTPTDAQNTINPVGKTDGVLGDGWQIQGGSTFNVITDKAGNIEALEIVSNKTLRSTSGGESVTRDPSGKIVKFTDIPDVPLEVVESKVETLLQNPIVDKFLGGLANVVKVVTLNQGGQGYEFMGETYNNAWDMMKDNPELGYDEFVTELATVGKNIAETTVQGTASNAFALRDFLQNIEIKSSIDDKGWKPFANNSDIENIGGAKGHVFSKAVIPVENISPEVLETLKEAQKNQANDPTLPENQPPPAGEGKRNSAYYREQPDKVLPGGIVLKWIPGAVTYKQGNPSLGLADPKDWIPGSWTDVTEYIPFTNIPASQAKKSGMEVKGTTAPGDKNGAPSDATTKSGTPSPQTGDGNIPFDTDTNLTGQDPIEIPKNLNNIFSADEIQSAQNLGLSFDEIQQILDNGDESKLNDAIEAEKFGQITDPTNMDWDNEEEVEYYMNKYFQDKGMPQDNTWLLMLLAAHPKTRVAGGILKIIQTVGNWYNKNKIPGPKGEEGWTWKKLLQDDWLKRQISDKTGKWNPFRSLYTWASDKGGFASGPTPLVREFFRRLGPLGTELLEKITDFGFEANIKPEIEGYSSEELLEKMNKAFEENPDDFEVFDSIMEKDPDYAALVQVDKKQEEVLKKYPGALSTYDVYKAFQEAAIPYYGVNYETDDGGEWRNTTYNKGYSDSMLGKVDALQKEVDGYTRSYGEYARWAKEQDTNRPGKPINDPDFKAVPMDDHYKKTGSGWSTDLTKSPYYQAEIQWLADNTPGFEYETYAKLNKEMVDLRPYKVEKVNFDLEGLDFFKQMTDPKNPGKFEELYKEVKEKEARVDDKFVTTDKERYDKAVEARNTYDESVSRLIKYFEKIMDQETQAGDKMRDYEKKARETREAEREKMQKNVDAELAKARAFYDKNVKPIWDDYSSLFDSDKELDELYEKIDFDTLFDNSSREYLLQTEKERIKNNWSNEDEEEDIDLSIEPVSPDPFVDELKAGLGGKDGDLIASAEKGNYDLYNWIIKSYNNMDAAEWYLKTGKTQGNPFLPQGTYVPKASLFKDLGSVASIGGADSATAAATAAAATGRKKKRNTPMVAHFKPRGKNLFERVSKLRKPNEFFNQDDIKPEFPENPPPKLDPKTGKHPEYGKKANRYKKLDPISANSMPPTGDPEIDAVVNKQKTINKIKKMARNK